MHAPDLCRLLHRVRQATTTCYEQAFRAVLLVYLPVIALDNVDRLAPSTAGMPSEPATRLLVNAFESLEYRNYSISIAC